MKQLISNEPHLTPFSFHYALKTWFYIAVKMCHIFCQRTYPFYCPEFSALLLGSTSQPSPLSSSTSLENLCHFPQLH
jgi:hypothetical protein